MHKAVICSTVPRGSVASWFQRISGFIGMAGSQKRDFNKYRQQSLDVSFRNSFSSQDLGSQEDTIPGSPVMEMPSTEVASLPSVADQVDQEAMAFLTQEHAPASQDPYLTCTSEPLPACTSRVLEESQDLAYVEDDCLTDSIFAAQLMELLADTSPVMETPDTNEIIGPATPLSVQTCNVAHTTDPMQGTPASNPNGELDVTKGDSNNDEEASPVSDTHPESDNSDGDSVLRFRDSSHGQASDLTQAPLGVLDMEIQNSVEVP